MYKVFCDGLPLYDPLNEFYLNNPKVSLELNKVGSFDFTIYPNHPYFNFLQKMKSIITVYDRNQMIFRGRILNDEEGFHNEKKVECESELAFLLDSVQRPYDYQGSLATLFEMFIQNHNEQVDEVRQFKLGNITVTDANDYIHYSDTTYMTTWESIGKKLIETHGGYLFVRHEADGNYLDYLSDFTLMSNQTIEFGKNLLDIAKTTKSEAIATAIIPLGKRDGTGDDSRRLTIESVNNGLDYVFDQDAVDKYGYIFRVVQWDDVTEATNLKTKGEEYLAEAVNLEVGIEITAVDLAGIDSDIGSFHLGTYVKVQTEPHQLDRNFLVQKISLDLANPKSNKLNLDSSFLTFTQQTSGVIKDIQTINETINNVVVDVDNQISSSITQSTDYILQAVAENYYLKDDTDTLISSVSTEFEQTKEQFNFSFNQFSKNLQDVINNTDARFTDITKYIRFVDGDIILGEEGNELILRIQNDRISFLENNLEVAYFSNKKLYVKDGEYLNSLTLGNYAFIPRENGNLSFKKVVNT